MSMGENTRRGFKGPNAELRLYFMAFLMVKAAAAFETANIVTRSVISKFILVLLFII